MKPRFSAHASFRNSVPVLFVLAALFALAFQNRACGSSFQELSADVARIIHDVSPGVVNISIVTERPVQSLVQPTNVRLPRTVFGKVRGTLQASGFFIDDKGTILTTASVLTGAESIEVALVDGQKLPARVVGVDPLSRIGVIQVTAPSPTLALRDGKNCMLGSIVVCLGNQSGLQYTPTLGMLSGVNRNIGKVIPCQPVLQISAPFSAGMAGAPVIDSEGAVIGMVCATYQPGRPSDSPSSPVLQLSSSSSQNRRDSVYDDAAETVPGTTVREEEYRQASSMRQPIDSGYSMDGLMADYDMSSSNMGFAVPIGLARKIAMQLVEKGKVTRGWLGIRAIEGKVAIPNDVRQHLHLAENQGIVVRSIVEGSPAGIAGVKARDILLSINGQPVSTPSDVFNLVEDLGPGTPVSLSIIREDEYVTLKTNLAERPDQF